MSEPDPSTPNSLCPHCGSTSVRKYGFFQLKNGERQQRFLCQACARTFNPLTGTPLHYLKKRDRWPIFLTGIVEGWSIRLSAARLHIHRSTAFCWRHRLLSALQCCPQPLLSGLVAISAAFIPYSEKGSRTGMGPGAYGRRKPGHNSTCSGHQYSNGRSYRRLIDGKPISVLLLSTGNQHALVSVGRGRILLEQLCQAMAPLVQAGSTVAAEGDTPFAEACSRLHLGLRPWSPDEPGLPQLPKAARISAWNVRWWLTRFRGVATRYLENYLAWFRMVAIAAKRAPGLAYSVLVAESCTRRVAEPGPQRAA